MIKTISLTANTETEIEISGGCHVSIENRGGSVIYASKNPDITAGADGVTAIDSGSVKILRNAAQYKNNGISYDYSGKIYLLSTADCCAEIQTANDLIFFRCSDRKAGGEKVAMTGKAYPVIYGGIGKTGFFETEE